MKRNKQTDKKWAKKKLTHFKKQQTDKINKLTNNELKKDQKDKENAHQSISVLIGPPHHFLNLLQRVVKC